MYTFLIRLILNTLKLIIVIDIVIDIILYMHIQIYMYLPIINTIIFNLNFLKLCVFTTFN
jgi:hypothetical protein